MVLIHNPQTSTVCKILGSPWMWIILFIPRKMFYSWLSKKKMLWFVGFPCFHGVNTPTWPFSTYQREVTELRIGKKSTKSALASQRELIPAHYWIDPILVSISQVKWDELRLQKLDNSFRAMVLVDSHTGPCTIISLWNPNNRGLSIWVKDLQSFLQQSNGQSTLADP